ncbi:MAG: 50S ribosomal protein L6 [Gammaproteobacteria bacterium]|nr:50S ribosomal protein L6 [Gammaproteobacteria bacterium]
MSRIGKKAINIPQGTTVEVVNNLVTVKGPKGELSRQFKNDVIIEVKDNQVHVSLPENPTQFSSTYHGTVRALINNMVVGCSEGFKIALEIKGTGYRATTAGSQLTLIIGYSNPVVMEIPAGLKVELPTQTDIVITGYDKQVIGEFAAGVRGVRPPEPYLGKGIRYKGENVRRKEGKTAK